MSTWTTTCSHSQTLTPGVLQAAAAHEHVRRSQRPSWSCLFSYQITVTCRRHAQRPIDPRLACLRDACTCNRLTKSNSSPRRRNTFTFCVPLFQRRRYHYRQRQYHHSGICYQHWQREPRQKQRHQHCHMEERRRRVTRCRARGENYSESDGHKGDETNGFAPATYHALMITKCLVFAFWVVIGKSAVNSGVQPLLFALVRETLGTLLMLGGACALEGLRLYQNPIKSMQV